MWSRSCKAFCHNPPLVHAAILEVHPIESTCCDMEPMYLSKAIASVHCEPLHALTAALKAAILLWCNFKPIEKKSRRACSHCSLFAHALVAAQRFVTLGSEAF
eukprot:gnl/MRDRNA2_/MRDRNA2_304398_c0_seq1.p1 gnl/MRDRNA2_/MRDRNA2_304398_c0~~gnl/MRDRNA2_/MRDRNA2_304398_c0_seq1.p1  ORF type:complete len:103 (-),score=9.26 gnl/MRDRNA2_/MRDRNA2_304398_c0_seq1:126-434(-)